ncbi:hypothetical protein Y1Q_0018287 [Alligator mississippiensis]|uniref:Uncharacterized protein n=1 Tax=Alligator mississippiensis TaxID=8496 RepID=A0A151PBI9_ALLMI|nr:hypothetical protein Y1Q_0018287 [Alligator mississippiensis]
MHLNDLHTHVNSCWNPCLWEEGRKGQNPGEKPRASCLTEDPEQEISVAASGQSEPGQLLQLLLPITCREH